MYPLQIVTLFAILNSSRSQKFNTFGRPKCCSDSLSPTLRQQQHWTETLREATYQSIIRHLDFSGTLDGRLDRDHALWRHLQDAKYIGDENSPGNTVEEIKTGALLEKPQGNRKVSFEFQQTDKSAFECTRKQCYTNNNSLLALWRVRRTENPYALWIRVRLPNIGETTIEDVYEYSARNGLKKLNPDPLQYSSIKGDKGHRFSVSPKKGEFKGIIDRMGFHFPGPNKAFGVGRVTPTSFMYSSPSSGKVDDGWVVSPQKPRPGVILETGLRNYNKGPLFNIHSGPFISSGPHGFRHIIHSLPSISPPQNLDHPNHEFKGFLPSTGPVNAPPPYRTEYAYDPRYILYYTNQPDFTPQYTTPPPKHFKPSTEFVRYSELDPFYHPDGGTDLLTSPMPEHNFQRPTPQFPNSINEQLPTNSPIRNTNPSFHIIVGNLNSDLQTSTEKIKPAKNKPLTTNTPSAELIPKSQTKSTEQPSLEDEDETTTKAFGDKIRPRIPIKPKTKTPTPKQQLTTTPTAEPDYEKEVQEFHSEKATTTGEENYSKQPGKVISTNNQDNQINNHLFIKQKTKPTQDVDNTDTTEIVEEPTTEESEMKTTNFDTEMTTEINKEVETVESSEVGRLDGNTTEIMELKLDPTQSAKLTNSTSEEVTWQAENNSTIDDYYMDETTDTNNETVTNDFQNTDDDSDFFSSLTNRFFPTEATTNKNYESTTIMPTKKSLSGDTDTETQESKQQNVQFRLLTFPGDSVSIVANRISKTVSYRTAAGNEGKLQNKQPIHHRHRFPEIYKDYSIIL